MHRHQTERKQCQSVVHRKPPSTVFPFLLVELFLLLLLLAVDFVMKLLVVMTKLVARVPNDAVANWLNWAEVVRQGLTIGIF